jgi:hypothetical protein
MHSTLLLLLLACCILIAPAAPHEYEYAPGVLSQKSNLGRDGTKNNYDKVNNRLPRDRFAEAVTVHDLPTVMGLVNAHKDGVLLSGVPPIFPGRTDTIGRSAMHVCANDPQSSSKPLVDVACSRILRLLQEVGFDVNQVCDAGWRPLDVYSAQGLPETVAALLEMGAVVNARDPEHGRTALMRAAINGNAVTVGVLLDAGADADVKASEGSALTVAVRNEVMNKINTPAAATPAAARETASEDESWDEWLSAQSSVQLYDETCTAENRGEGSVDYGCEPGKQYLLVIERLLAHGADANVKDDTGKTPLMLASAAGHEGLVRTLLKSRSVDVRLVDGDGLGAITFARTDAIRDLLVDYLVETVK